MGLDFETLHALRLEVIDEVFDNYDNLDRSLLCNPYMIEYPKPYGMGPKMMKEIATVIDTCNCSRMAQLKSEAIAAYYDPTQLSSFNDYLESRYKDTLTQVLFDAFTKCDSLAKTYCTTTYTTIDLAIFVAVKFCLIVYRYQ